MQRLTSTLMMEHMPLQIFLKINHEDAVDFLENAYNTINKQQECERALAAGFEKCGLNFRASSHQMFESYLESLNEDGIHKVLTKNHTATGLTGTVPPVPVANVN